MSLLKEDEDVILATYGEGDKERKIDLLFDHVDNLLLDGKFDRVSSILDAADPRQMTTTLMVGYLSITNFASPVLSAREDFIRRVGEELDRICPERKHALLDGFTRQLR